MVKQISDLKTPYKYFAVIKNGLDWRLFNDLSLCCNLMGLDKKIVKKHCDRVGYYTAYDFTIFQVQEENKNIHRPDYIS